MKLKHETWSDWADGAALYAINNYDFNDGDELLVINRDSQEWELYHYDDESGFQSGCFHIPEQIEVDQKDYTSIWEV